jgi:hypothetical protein
MSAALQQLARKRRQRPDMFDGLTFVVDQGGGQGRILWGVETTGNYIRDCALGEDYAAIAMPVLTGPEGAWVLALIVQDMIKAGPDAAVVGIVTGFCHGLQRHLVRHGRPA